MTPARLAALLLLATACSSGRQLEVALRVPAGDKPLADADAVTISIADASGRVLVSQRGPATAQDLTVTQVPDGQGLTLTLEASFGADVVARGRSCPFDVDAATPAIPLYFSRVGGFASTGAPAAARQGAAMLTLDAGVFVAGGSDGNQPLASTERFDPASGTFVAGPTLDQPRAGASWAVLRSGVGLLFGGAAPLTGGAEALSDTKSVPIPSLIQPELVDAAAVLLGDGRALLAGGRSGTGGAPLAAVWLVDPTGTTIELGPQLPRPRAQHTATATSTDRHSLVLLAGGAGPSGPEPALDLFDPMTNSFIPAGVLTVPRVELTATRISDGLILIVGGRRADGGVESSAELFDLATRQVRPAGALRVARAQHAAVLLPSGRVLIAGGVDASGQPIGSAEIFDPTLGDSGDFVPTSSLVAPRAAFAALPLCDQTILLAGGGAGAERYNPFP